MSDKSVMGIIFVGSTNAGRTIGKIAAENLKKSILELGGNDPFIVLKTADIE